MIENMPLPATDNPTDTAFWQAALQNRLVVQACTECGALRHPPRVMCPHCQSMLVTWREMSGLGRIWSFAAPEPPLLPAFEALLPYVTAVVELKEDPAIRIVGALLKEGRMAGVTPGDVRIGAPVRAVFLRAEDDVALPAWELTDTEQEGMK